MRSCERKPVEEREYFPIFFQYLSGQLLCYLSKIVKDGGFRTTVTVSMVVWDLGLHGTGVLD